ncbi:MAG: hypothetical protein ACRCVL_04645, partial [Cetobacterium sp.]
SAGLSCGPGSRAGKKLKVCGTTSISVSVFHDRTDCLLLAWMLVLSLFATGALSPSVLNL